MAAHSDCAALTHTAPQSPAAMGREAGSQRRRTHGMWSVTLILPLSRNLLRLDSLSQKTHTFVSIAIEIGDIDISSYGGELGDQDTLRREWRGTATQLPLFCNCRFTGIRADGAHFGSCATRGGVRLLFAFYTGSSDLGFPRSPR